VDLTLSVFVNGDDALLQWIADEIPDELRGFAVQRRRNGGEPEYLETFVPPGPDEHQNGQLERSDAWPFRTFSWTDHLVNLNDRVRYRVVPVFWTERHVKSEPRLSEASAWSDERTLAPGAPDSRCSVYFNRGFVLSQFASRYVREKFGAFDVAALRKFKAELRASDEAAFRAFLGGPLRVEMLRWLDNTRRNGGEIFAALYELEDPELLKRMTALGPRAHVVLSNGSVKVKGTDQNAEGREALHRAGVQVVDRMVSPGALGHNKFVVVCDRAGAAKRVWTGSTNWTPTGLCTQINNGLMVEDAELAARYLAQWRLLSSAGNAHPAALTRTNGEAITVKRPAARRKAALDATVRFSRAPHRVDLDELKALVAGTEHGLLFLMFRPGENGVLPAVRKLAKDKPQVLVRGVVSTLETDAPEHERKDVDVEIFGTAGDEESLSRSYSVIEPTGFEHPVSVWAAETTRGRFMSGVGPAIVHSKVLVVDPFGDHPTVVTGSHNFSDPASAKNDENYVVIRDDPGLAEAYAVNIQSAWRHYAPRTATARTAADRNAKDLKDEEWLRAQLAGQEREAAFWGLG
jgi:PLD-like domain